MPQTIPNVVFTPGDRGGEYFNKLQAIAEAIDVSVIASNASVLIVEDAEAARDEAIAAAAAAVDAATGDGQVLGPYSVDANTLAVFDGVTGHLFKQGVNVLQLVLSGQNISKLNNDVGYLTSITAGSIGLGNVDNTSDANKPISSATQSALDGKATSAQGTLADTALQPGGVIEQVSFACNDASYGGGNFTANTMIDEIDTFDFDQLNVGDAVRIIFVGGISSAASNNVPAASIGIDAGAGTFYNIAAASTSGVIDNFTIEAIYCRTSPTEFRSYVKVTAGGALVYGSNASKSFFNLNVDGLWSNISGVRTLNAWCRSTGSSRAARKSYHLIEILRGS